MNILGIDPGATTGWCLYDSVARRVIAAGDFDEHRCAAMWAACCQRKLTVHAIVMERPKGYGPTRPQLVDCGYVAGRIAGWFTSGGCNVEELTRIEVKNTLREATHGEVSLKNDACVWAALKLLHGEGCDKKGGALHGVRAHERAALAVAVAWALRETAAKGASA